MKLLVCVDYSPLTERVLAEAITIAKPVSAHVVLLHVAEAELALTSGGAAPSRAHRPPPSDIAERRAELEALASRLRAEGLEVETQPAITDGDVWEVVVEQIEAKGATHVLLGSHGRSRMFEFLVGSVTQGVLRHAPVPVIVVPAER